MNAPLPLITPFTVIAQEGVPQERVIVHWGRSFKALKNPFFLGGVAAFVYGVVLFHKAAAPSLFHTDEDAHLTQLGVRNIAEFKEEIGVIISGLGVLGGIIPGVFKALIENITVEQPPERNLYIV